MFEDWRFAAFGLNTSADTQDNGYCRNDDGSVTLWSLHNRGKLNQPSTDGLAFYYTTVPADCCFTLKARACLESWTFTNGQEAFGLMAADRIGRHGEDCSFWNNSCMAVCGRVEYRLDPETGAVVSDRQYPLISMKLGLGALEKKGVTPQSLPELEAGNPDAVKKWISCRMLPLETSCAEYGAGSYNLFGNEQTGRVIGTVDNPLTEVVLLIRRTPSVFEVSWLDDTGVILGTRHFPATDALCALDPDNVYVGLFAARFCRVTFKDISLETWKNTGGSIKAVRPEPELMSPTCRIISSRHSNHALYLLRFVTNADGRVRIAHQGKQNEESVIPVTAGVSASFRLLLEEGDNAIELCFEPCKDYCLENDLGLFRVIDRNLIRKFTVSFVPVNGVSTIFVAPDGTSGGEGTRESPVDIHTAIACASLGCDIILLEGLYQPGRPIVVERDISSARDRPIHLHAEQGKRAIFDFQKRSPGFTFAGSYWEIDHIDCLNTADFSPGIVLCGHDIHLHHVRACGNGDVGIVIWTYLDTDTRDDWPHDIQVTDCISCNNADPGATNADGFAAKLTVGPGVVFDNCISCFNADDGWDLFTKVELGTTSPVIIKNCVAFGNGFNPKGQPRGYGNGFKLGGTSLPAGHYLYNCVAWGNRFKGIDSNTAPNENIAKCTSFDNLAANVALYTSDAKNTDYVIHGLCSLRTHHRDTEDILAPQGSQNEADIIARHNFYWQEGRCRNGEGLEIPESWFESLEPPRIDPNRLLDSLEQLRNKAGRINLGRFLKLTEGAIRALRSEGFDPRDVTAHLHED